MSSHYTTQNEEVILPAPLNERKFCKFKQTFVKRFQVLGCVFLSWSLSQVCVWNISIRGSLLSPFTSVTAWLSKLKFNLQFLLSPGNNERSASEDPGLWISHPVSPSQPHQQGHAHPPGWVREALKQTWTWRCIEDPLQQSPKHMLHAYSALGLLWTKIETHCHLMCQPVAGTVSLRSFTS